MSKNRDSFSDETMTPEEKEADRNKKALEAESSDQRSKNERSAAGYIWKRMKKTLPPDSSLSPEERKIKEESNKLLEKYNADLNLSPELPGKSSKKNTRFDTKNIETTTSEARTIVDEMKKSSEHLKRQREQSKKDSKAFDLLIIKLKNAMPKDKWKDFFKITFDPGVFRNEHSNKIDPKIEAFLILREGIDKISEHLRDEKNPISLDDAKALLREYVEATIKRSDSVQNRGLFGKIGVTKSLVSQALSSFLSNLDEPNHRNTLK